MSALLWTGTSAVLVKGIVVVNSDLGNVLILHNPQLLKLPVQVSDPGSLWHLDAHCLISIPVLSNKYLFRYLLNTRHQLLLGLLKLCGSYVLLLLESGLQVNQQILFESEVSYLVLNLLYVFFDRLVVQLLLLLNVTVDFSLQ